MLWNSSGNIFFFVKDSCPLQRNIPLFFFFSFCLYFFFFLFLFASYCLWEEYFVLMAWLSVMERPGKRELKMEMRQKKKFYYFWRAWEMLPAMTAVDYKGIAKKVFLLLHIFVKTSVLAQWLLLSFRALSCLSCLYE